MRPVLAFALSLLLVAPAMATTDDFVETCMAHAADLDALPAALDALSLDEVEAVDGPQFMPLPETAERRLWQRPVKAPGEKSALYVSLIHVPGDVPLNFCIVTGFPGDNAVVALEKLQALYPPHEGSIKRGPEIFYGGEEGWTTTIGGIDYALSVTWAFHGTPEVGPSTQMLLVP